MGYMVNLGLCEVCGKKVPPGEKYCTKHKDYKEDSDEEPIRTPDDDDDGLED